MNNPILKKLALFSALTLPLSYILGVIARSLWYNPRPFVVKGIEPLIAHIPDNGFPSDHTLLLATLASIAYYFDKKYSAALWVVTILVGLSRVFAQVHHLVDILASMVIALVSAKIAYAIIHPLWNKQKQTNF
ncbi:MAG: phosphatase PAP2 family protein [Patescibacteria group bacterium]